MHQIGAGTLGPVFRAYEPDQDRLVAVKLFHLDLPPERVHQLVSELEQLVGADLTHPSIAAPLAAGISGTSAYFAQDFVAADSLDIVVREHGPAPASDALRVAAQLGGALDFAAAVDVLHGALHPRDVLISPDDTRVIGHGITRALERVGVAAPIRRPYAAPERTSGAAWDRRADIYSLAVLIYEMLAGKRLTHGSQREAMLGAVACADPAALNRVFARALADAPADRFASALEFADALKSALIARPSPASRKAEPKSPSPVPDDLAALPFDEPLPDPLDIRKVHDGRPALDLHLHEDAREEIVPAPADDEPVIQLREEIAIELLEPQAAVPDIARVERGVAPTVVPPAAPPMPAPAPPIETSAPQPAPTASPEPPPAPAPSLAPSVPLLTAAASTASRSDRASVDESTPKTAGDVVISPVRSQTVDAPRRAPDLMRPTAFLDQGSDEFRARALEKTRSAIWPLAMAIGVGLVVGFAAGYGTALRDRAVRAGIDGNPPAQVASAPAERGGGSSAASADPGAAPTTPDTTPPGRAAMPPSAAAGPGAPAVIPPDGSIEREAPPKREQPPREASSRATTRQDEAKRQAAAAPAGRLLIRSTPAGARVTVDGRDAGVTPATVRELARGPHIVRIAADGYAQEERRIVLTGERMAQSMQFDLVRSAAAGVPAADAAGAGSLTVESRPSGAPVYVDGKLIGTTPLTLESVGSGDHSIGIAQPGYQRWIASVRVTAGERARVTASLER